MKITAGEIHEQVSFLQNALSEAKEDIVSIFLDTAYEDLRDMAQDFDAMVMHNEKTMSPKQKMAFKKVTKLLVDAVHALDDGGFA